MKNKILALAILLAPQAAYADRQFVFALADQFGYLMHGCVGEPARANDQQKAAILAHPPREVHKSGIIGSKTGGPVLEGLAVDGEGHVVRLRSYLNVKVGAWEQGSAYICGSRDVAQVVSKLSGQGVTGAALTAQPSVQSSEEFIRLKSAVNGADVTAVFGR